MPLSSHLLPRLGTVMAGVALCLGALASAGAADLATPTDLGPVATPAAATVRSTLAPGWEHGAFMEIFVRAWRDSNGDGVGDLKGLTQSLDYLQALGVTGLWLMPITASEDHDHGYATTNFRAIEPAYGSLADFDELLREAHARGIGVIIDYVINHSAAGHPLFQQSASSPTNPWRDWYVWQPTAPTGWDIWGKDPWTTTPNGAYFGTFGPHMPDFNMRNPAVVAWHADNLRFWLNRGLDGFRLDAVPHLIENNAKDWNDQPESRALTGELVRLIRSYPQRHVVCEATAEPIAYASPALCGSAFAFGLETQFSKAAQGDAAAIQKIADYFRTAPTSMATFVSNHDGFAGQRLWDQVGGDLARYRLAAASYLLLPGTPFIYYGEEVGMSGTPGLPGDEPIRNPMSWSAAAAGGKGGAAGFSSGKAFRAPAANLAQQNVAAQLGDPNSLLSFYQAMLQLRQRLPSIARGSYLAPVAQGTVLSYQRALGVERTLVAINYGSAPATLALRELPEASRWTAAYPLRGSAPWAADAQGRATLTLPPQSVQVFQVQP